MDTEVLSSLFEETVALFSDAVSSSTTASQPETTPSSFENTPTSFAAFIHDYLPGEYLQELRCVMTGDYDDDASDADDFLHDVWHDRFYVPADPKDSLDPSLCSVCERYLPLTRHHLYPRSTHQKLIKRKGYTKEFLSASVLSVCRQCHNAIHRFFVNEELAESYFTLDLLLDAPKFFKYAKCVSPKK